MSAHCAHTTSEGIQTTVQWRMALTRISLHSGSVWFRGPTGSANSTFTIAASRLFSGNKQELRFSVHRLYLGFTFRGEPPSLANFLVNEPKWTPAFCVLCALPSFMLRHAALDIVGDARVERSVSALQNIDGPVQRPLPCPKSLYLSVTSISKSGSIPVSEKRSRRGILVSKMDRGNFPGPFFSD